ncbi:hypothetical protein H5410_035915 [Solanum commersonii]|uniref:Uncharacterized protein n=1 Tax=Solanum commersonii TaxID=4109 RepID=A0A9J5Y223_SOLCO|nr:hypothetical protein H5410_035915 [Solanum commersonii]
MGIGEIQIETNSFMLVNILSVHRKFHGKLKYWWKISNNLLGKTYLVVHLSQNYLLMQKKFLNLDKQEVANLRIKTKKINQDTNGGRKTF